MKHLLPLLFLPAMGSAQAQTQSVGLLREGSLLSNGDRVVSFSHLRVNNSGDWVSFVQTDNPDPGADEVQVVNGGIVLAEGTAGGAGGPIEEFLDMDLDPAGNRTTLWRTAAGFQLYYSNNFILNEGTDASGLGLGAATYTNMFKVQVNGSNQLLVRCLVDAPAVAPIPLSCLVNIEVDGSGVILSETLLGSSGDIFPGQTTPFVAFNNGDNAVSFQDDGTGTWSGLLGPLASPSPHVLYQNATTLLAQGGGTSPVLGRTWATQQVQASASNASGSTAFSGLLSGSTTDDELIVLDGAVFLREGDTLPGSVNPTVLSIGYFNLFLSDAGDPIYLVRVNTALGDRIAMRGLEPMLRKGSFVFQGAEITDLIGGEHGMHASPSGRFLLSRVELDGSDEALVLTQDPISQDYCSAEPNSTGTFAQTVAEGSSVVHVNEFGLRLEDAPPGVFTYFLASLTPGDVPFAGGSQGRLCLGGTIGRYIAQVGQVSGAGTFSLEIDLAAIPTTPASEVMPGDIWHFQAWYRDVNPGNTSNFSAPVRVEFL